MIEMITVNVPIGPHHNRLELAFNLKEILNGEPVQYRIEISKGKPLILSARAMSSTLKWRRTILKTIFKDFCEKEDLDWLAYRFYDWDKTVVVGPRPDGFTTIHYPQT